MPHLLFVSLVAVALAWGAVVWRATIRDAQADLEFLPEGVLLEVEGRQVHAVTRGSGPDIVLIHGASGNARDFTFRLAGRLARTHRVIAFDRPGHGHSDALHREDKVWGHIGASPAEQAYVLRAAARMLGVERPIVLGHSYGASVALAWAIGDPGTVSGLVLVGGASMPWPGRLGAYYRILGSRLGGAVLPPLISAFITRERLLRATEAVFVPHKMADGYAEHVGAALAARRASLRANARQVMSLRPHIVEMQKSYPKLTLPVEIIHGVDDEIVPIDVHARPLSRALQNARLTEVDKVGHMPHHLAPDVVIDAVLRLSAIR